MKELFQDIGEYKKCYDTQTLEFAILALIEKEDLEDMKIRYLELLK